LYKYKDAFSLQGELGFTTTVCHRIPTNDAAAIPINLTSPSGVAMPTAVATAVSVPDILSFADNLASKYKIYGCFYRALNIVAIISGARWSLVPLFADFPAGDEAGRQGPVQRREPSDFNRRLAYTPDQDTAALFNARPPTAEEVAARGAPIAWEAAGNDLVRDDNAEVVPSIFVGVLPYSTTFENIRLPRPRFNNWLLCHLNIIPDEDDFAVSVIKNDILGHYRDIDLKCMKISSMVATAASTVLIDWNLTGHEVAALSGALTDLPVQLFEWSNMMNGFTTLLPAPGPGSSLATTVANTVRTLYYVDFPDVYV